MCSLPDPRDETLSNKDTNNEKPNESVKLAFSAIVVATSWEFVAESHLITCFVPSINWTVKDICFLCFACCNSNQLNSK